MDTGTVASSTGVEGSVAPGAKHAADGGPRIPAPVCIAQIYFPVTLSYFPLHLSPYSKRLLTYRITASWGLRSRANGVSTSVNKAASVGARQSQGNASPVFQRGQMTVLSWGECGAEDTMPERPGRALWGAGTVTMALLWTFWGRNLR